MEAVNDDPDLAANPLPDPADPATVLLFDLDGTVSDSAPGIHASFRHALDRMGAPEPTEDFLAGIVGPPLLDSMVASGFTGDQAQRAVAVYRERYDVLGYRENSVYDGITELLADLVAAGRTLAIATSKNEHIATKVLEHFGLSGHFGAIAGASDDGSRRTKAQVIARALNMLGVDRLGSEPMATPVIMIGDRAHDVVGAASLGLPTIAVSWGYARPGEVDEATWTVETVPQLREVLGV
ncbi:putative hydrolase [Gordonia hirsuta DSM 44140 = NBRC 16056]|uniref:Putative hydrolase n=1 Tax=Gordonia hirsuta DSM 44140 = NBRC 16056 TaxID=1121927 RepID=L7LAN0_9ACTN|nr:HAD hydrolase-like protein [Gordonia hirsuta]GAC57078.1 putative hydrolase [Gordonia hirsuta DSM 44140 = NBRC 16056]